MKILHRTAGAFLVLMAIGQLAGAELEQITISDGRRFIGYYDAGAGTITIEGPPKAVIRVTAEQVVGRSPVVRAPETDPVKRDEAELVRLEAEHAAAIADATRLRKFATTRSGKDAEVALSQADERAAQAARAAEKIDAVKARLVAAKPAAPAADLLPTAPAKTKSDDAAAALTKARESARRLREEAISIEFDASVKWLEAQNLSKLVPPDLSDDPRKSEVEARQRAITESKRRAMFADILVQAKEAQTIQDKESVVEQLRGLQEVDNERKASRKNENKR
jgi:hypothetical protein